MLILKLLILKLLILKLLIQITKMADRFWKSMPSALKKPTLDELYRRLRDLDYTQVDERMAVMLNAILQLEEQGECRESATEAVLMVGYTTDGVSNQEQTRWLSWNVDGAIRGFDLARNPGLNNNTEYGAGEFPLPVRPPVRSSSQSTSKVPSISPFMMLTGRERAMPLTFFYPEYEGKRTSPQAYVKEAIRRQQELNELCRRNTAQAQMRQRKKYDEKILQAKPYEVGQYVWVFQNVIPPKGTKKLLKKWRGPFMITEVHQQ